MNDQSTPANGASSEALIQQAIQTLFIPGTPVEIRGKKPDKSIRLRFYSDHAKITQALAKASKDGKFEALWYTLQRLKPDIDPVERSKPVLDPHTGKLAIKATDRNDILSYEWLVIDVDRKDQTYKKLNATDEELKELHRVGLLVIAWLKSMGFPAPIFACSGNGWHILYKLNHLLPTEYTLLEDVLRAVWHQFINEPIAVIDKSLAEPEQVIKAYGTPSHKTPADHPDILIRPWRQSYLESVPDEILAVEHSILESVAALAPPKPKENPKGEMPALHEDFDSEDFFDHFEKQGAFHITGTSNWQGHDIAVTDHCITARKKHTGSGLTGFIIGDTFGYHCFSDDCTGVRIGDVLRKLADEGFEPYTGDIWSRDDFSDIAESVDYDDVVPEAAPVKTNGHSKECFFCHRTKADGCTCDPKVTQDAVEESARQVKEENERRRPEREAQKARREALYQEIEDAEDEAIPTAEPCECPAIETKVNQRLAFGPMPEACMYGYLGQLARRLQCPLGYAYPTVLAVYTSRHLGIATRTIRQNVNVVLLGDTSTGKTRTMNRAMSVVGTSMEFIKVVDNAIGSGEGLVEKLGGKKDSQIQPLDRFGLPVLLHQDEMRELMAKMAIDNSSIPYKLNRLWERDDIGTNAKKSTLTAFANASFLGGLTVESPAEFAALFGRGTVSGFYVRNIYGWAPEGWRFDDMWEEENRVPMEIHPPNKNIRVRREIFAMKNDWEMVNPKVRGQRLSQNAMRIALITAAANGDQEITEECVRCALMFCEWQETLRSRYKPSHAETPGGKLTEIVMNEAWSHMDADGNFEWFSWRDAYKHNHWEREDAVGLARQRDQLRKIGFLETEKIEEGSRRAPRIRATKESK